MKRFCELCRFVTVALVLGLCFLVGNVSALTIPTPSPSPPFSFGDDLQDPGLFSVEAQVLSIEIFDFGAETNSAGSEFGFYFEGASDPLSLITIFDSSDQALPQQSALIDFADGTVADVDESSLQDTFTPGSGNIIGFYLILDQLFGGGTLFTQSFLNPGGEDHAATFPILSPPENVGDFLIAFAFIDDNESVQEAAFEFASGITPVPEPSTLLLLGFGLLGLATFERKRRRK